MSFLFFLTGIRFSLFNSGEGLFSKSVLFLCAVVLRLFNRFLSLYCQLVCVLVVVHFLVLVLCLVVPVCSHFFIFLSVSV